MSVLSFSSFANDQVGGASPSRAFFAPVPRARLHGENAPSERLIGGCFGGEVLRRPDAPRTRQTTAATATGNNVVVNFRMLQ